MRTDEERQRVRRLQNRLTALAVVVVFLGVAIPTAGFFYFQEQATEEQERADASQLVVNCTNAQANIDTLEALDAIGDGLTEFAEQLGVPFTAVEFEIPEVPAECES